MTIIGLLRREFALMRHHVTGIIQGLTKDYLLWAPPGVANPIGTTLLHVLTGEDRLIQGVLQGKPSLWEAGRWYEQIGIISLPVRGNDWTGVDLALLQAPALFAYAQVVDQATSTYLNLLNHTDHGGARNRSFQRALSSSCKSVSITPPCSPNHKAKRKKES